MLFIVQSGKEILEKHIRSIDRDITHIVQIYKTK